MVDDKDNDHVVAVAGNHDIVAEMDAVEPVAVELVIAVEVVADQEVQQLVFVVKYLMLVFVAKVEVAKKDKNKIIE